MEAIREMCRRSCRDVRTIASTRRAFAAIKIDGSVVTWGRADHGGDSSAVAAELSSGVQSVIGNAQAFVAIKTDGSVVTWGDTQHGGDRHYMYLNEILRTFMLTGGSRSWYESMSCRTCSIITRNAGGVISGTISLGLLMFRLIRSIV